jgi:hypothetical protein
VSIVTHTQFSTENAKPQLQYLRQPSFCRNFPIFHPANPFPERSVRMFVYPQCERNRKIFAIIASFALAAPNRFDAGVFNHLVKRTSDEL